MLTQTFPLKVKVPCFDGRKRAFRIGLEFVLGIFVLLAVILLAISFIVSRVVVLGGRTREYYIAVEER